MYAGGQIDTLNSNPNVVPVNATGAEVVVYTGPRGETVTDVVVCVFILLFNVLK